MFTVTLAGGEPICAEVQSRQVQVEVLQKTSPTWLRVTYDIPFPCAGEEYVLFPGCCYDGNRFEVLKKPYPPVFTEEDSGVNMPVTITDVPRLHKDGSGVIEVTTGDVSVPCMGLYSGTEQKGVLLFTQQQWDGVNLGLVYEKGRMELRWPYFREKAAYRWPRMIPSVDEGHVFEAGEQVTLSYRLYEFDCRSMEEFYEVFLDHRKCMGLDCSRPAIFPFEEQWNTQREKFNYLNWYEKGGFYGHNSKADHSPSAWSPGWCGGGISSYAMMKLGGPLEEQRAIRTLEHIYKTQRPTGFLQEAADAEGSEMISWLNPAAETWWHLTRQDGDVLYFTFKHFAVMQERGIAIPALLINGAKKLADAFVTLWDTYGQLGQFVDAATGELKVGGSTAGAIAVAGLCSAWNWFGDRRYLETAKLAAQQYYDRDAARGYTTGGPGEILQGPDSESAAGLLEGLICLYEQTKEAHWLEKAKHVANLCASWTVSYNYRFPADSEFAKLDMKTCGAIFANVQNKHAAPGICTLSGDSLYKLYTFTGDARYKELFEDTALTISQYLSMDKRPIYSWKVPKDATLLGDDSLEAKPERLLPGYMSERVNMSDWESLKCVGGVFNGSCWCETTNLLVLAECVPLLDQSTIQFR